MGLFFKIMTVFALMFLSARTLVSWVLTLQDGEGVLVGLWAILVLYFGAPTIWLYFRGKRGLSEKEGLLTVGAFIAGFLTGIPATLVQNIPMLICLLFLGALFVLPFWMMSELD